MTTYKAKEFFFSVFTSTAKKGLAKRMEEFLFFLIVANVFAAAIETIPFVAEKHFPFFYWFEIFSVFLFTIEYFLRLWVVPLYKNYEKGVFVNRLRFALRPMMIFDLAVILPFYLNFFFFIDIRWIRAFRLLRIFRTLRIAGYSEAFERVFRVIQREKEELLAVLWIMIVLLIISSSLVFLAERHVPNTPFTSIPAALWWGIATITTIGYGDMVPVTDIGKFFGSLTAILGVGVFALPTGLIGSSFYHDVASRRERQIKKIGEEIDILQTSAEESEGLIADLFRKQNRKIHQLEKELLKAHATLQEHVITPETKKSAQKKSPKKKKKN